MKQIYLIRHKYVPYWKYVGASKSAKDILHKKWGSKQGKMHNNLCMKAFRCSERKDWETVLLHDFSEDWETLEAKYIQQYDTFRNGLNSTASGAWESTPKHRASMRVVGLSLGPKSRKAVVGAGRIYFDSGKQAEERTGINAKNIASCCTGKRKTAGGFTWRHATKQEIQLNA